MDTTNLSKKLVRVEYPGIVKNVDNMLATLGGINGISEVINEEITTNISDFKSIPARLITNLNIFTFK